jgi:hypothetical protein
MYENWNLVKSLSKSHQSDRVKVSQGEKLNKELKNKTPPNQKTERKGRKDGEEEKWERIFYAETAIGKRK